ncbi:unnamed protein product [Gongylonema pulchrum]|uniref:X8 domain-containing protein n=1 Tax=Gongylonema pulchrum TaxID=637853 RepID=A0A183EWG0_9BILA|nr:unnamed protein product [Gongylonema pulchrum]
MDIVAHLPACQKDESYPEKSKPCLGKAEGYAYHHGTEIWYPTGMTDGAKYQECLGAPQDEDFKCSDQYKFNARDYKKYFLQHRYYFGVRVSLFFSGRSFCKPGGTSTEKGAKQILFRSGSLM